MVESLETASSYRAPAAKLNGPTRALEYGDVPDRATATDEVGAKLAGHLGICRRLFVTPSGQARPMRVVISAKRHRDDRVIHRNPWVRGGLVARDV